MNPADPQKPPTDTPVDSLAAAAAEWARGDAAAQYTLVAKLEPFLHELLALVRRRRACDETPGRSTVRSTFFLRSKRPGVATPTANHSPPSR